MRYLLVLLLFAVSAAAQEAVEDNGEQAEAAKVPAEAVASQPGAEGTEYKLVDLLGGKERTLEIQTQLIDAMVAANPAWEPYRSTLKQWAELYVGWQEMREGMAQVYRDYFSPEELDELLVFYRSDTGRKSIILMPSLLRAGNQLGATLAEKHRTELVEMLRQASKGPAAQ